MRSADLPTPPISGNTRFLAHVGYPTHTFKSPSIYNPYFASIGIDFVLVPFAVESDLFGPFLRSIVAVRNLAGVIVTMPHKVSVLSMLDDLSPSAAMAGSCNAVRVGENGRLYGDMFDGVGFVRAVEADGFQVTGSRVFVAGAGGVGSAIVASLAAGGAAEIDVVDPNISAAESLATRVARHAPATTVRTHIDAPDAHDLVVNATPIGMKPHDPLPMNTDAIAPGSFVCDVVLGTERTPFLERAASMGARIQNGHNMLYEQIPAYLEFFGLPVTSAATLREVEAQTRGGV